ncbi:MAG: efflux RND transporter periplasmic adaptor subunit [Pseudomonadota bacterium]
MSAGPALAQGRPALVDVAKAEPMEFAETAPILGRLVAPTQAEIATRIAGIVEAVHVVVGDRVKAGDLIANLDRERLDIQREAAEATLRQTGAAINVARANLEIARQAFERIESLQQSAAFSRARYEDLAKEAEAATGDLLEAEARAAKARADLAEARYNIRNTEIRAAVDGVVLSRDVHPGEYMQVGATIAMILNDADLEIEADIPTEYIGAVTPGMNVRVTLDDGSDHSARVRALVPNESLATRTRPVRLTPDFAELGKPLAAGQTTTLHIPIGAGRQVLTIPKDALVQASGGWIVYQAVDGKAAPRPVSIGGAIGNRFEVRSGLEAGAIVVIRGNERLRPGQEIQFDPASLEDKSEPAAEESEGTPAPERQTSGFNTVKSSGG